MPPGRTSTSRAELAFLLVLGVEHQHAAHFGVAHKQAVAVVHGQAHDQPEIRLFAVADEFHMVFVLRIKNEYRAHSLVPGVDFCFRIHCHAVRTDELEWKLVNLYVVGLLLTGHAVHPGLLFFSSCQTGWDRFSRR